MKRRKSKPKNFKPEEFFPDDHRSWPGKRRCTAWNSNHGRQCGKPAMKGKTKCERCGGKTPSGPASPSFKHGRYSQDLPANLAARYQQAANDPQLLTLRDEIGLIEAFIVDQLQNLDAATSTQLWSEAQKAFGQLKAAAAAEDVVKYSLAEARLTAAIEAGLSQAAGQDRVVRLSDEKRKLVESERKRHVEMQQMITSERVMVLITALVSGFREMVLTHCSPDIAQIILAGTSDNLTRLLNAGEIIEGQKS